MENKSSEIENTIIIGSGPAGHSAAIYTGRAMLKPLMFEGFMAGGIAAGGQLTTTAEVENYAGFPDGISGPELMERMRAQSLKYGCRIETQTIDSVNLNASPREVQLGQGKDARIYRSHTIIIATGATAQRLHIKGEDELWQKGISACAICDGALPIYRNVPLVVVGGGDSACEEAGYLSKYGSGIHLLVRRDELRASKTMQHRVMNNPKITIHWNTEVIEAIKGPANAFGNHFLGAVQVKNNLNGEETKMETKGLFYALGHVPNTGFLKGQLQTDSTGYLLTAPGSTATDIAGVFACGDVQDHTYRQAITAAGSGCMAALEAERWMVNEGLCS